MDYNLNPQQILEEIKKIREEKRLLVDDKVKPLSEYEISRLPVIPEDWKWVTINEISTYITNGVHTPTSITDDNKYGLRCLRITDIQEGEKIDYSSLPFCLRIVSGDYEKKLKKGDIYFSFTGANLGKRYIVKEDREDTVFAHYFVRWQPIVVNPYFIYYVAHSKIYDQFIQEHTLGSTQPNLKVTDLKRFPIPLCDLETQNKIANILSLIDEKIDTNLFLISNLQELATTIFNEYFLKDGDTIPVSWRKTTLSNETINLKERCGNSDYKVFSALNTGNLVLSEEHFTKQVFSKDISKYIKVEPFDFAYNPARVNIGSLGINDLGFAGCVSPVYVAFRVENEYQYFFKFYFKTAQFRQETIQRASGSVRQNLNYKDFGMIEIIYPSIEMIRKFNDEYTKILNKQNMLKEENKKLIELKETLLPKLVLGELDVRNIKI